MLTRLSLITIALVINLSSSAFAQKKPTAPAGPLLTRTISRHEVRRFGFGGTMTVIGAPRGSITIEGWSKNEIDLTAEIEVQGATEADMALVAGVTGFLLDDDSNHMNLITTGMHDKSYMRKAAKNFPKQLLSMPWKIDYKLRVPQVLDMEINGGAGPINMSGVEGLLSLKALQGDVTLSLTGRVANITIGAGTLNFIIPAQSWRGSGADVQLAAGQLNVDLPPGFSGDIDADILRTGKIDNAFGLEGRERTSMTEKSVRARAGVGGAALKFTIGDGEIHFRKAVEKQ
jgi:hypothetical protein